MLSPPSESASRRTAPGQRMVTARRREPQSRLPHWPCCPGSAWAYTSSVNATDAWPHRSETTRTFVPATRRCVVVCVPQIVQPDTGERGRAHRSVEGRGDPIRVPRLPVRLGEHNAGRRRLHPSLRQGQSVPRSEGAARTDPLPDGRLYGPGRIGRRQRGHGIVLRARPKEHLEPAPMGDPRRPAHRDRHLDRTHLQPSPATGRARPHDPRRIRDDHDPTNHPGRLSQPVSRSCNSPGFR